VSFGLADDAGNGARIPTLAKIVLDMRRAQHRVGPFRSASDNSNLDLDFLPAGRAAAFGGLLLPRSRLWSSTVPCPMNKALFGHDVVL
jgi:hypothetical protein